VKSCRPSGEGGAPGVSATKARTPDFAITVTANILTAGDFFLSAGARGGYIARIPVSQEIIA
jgi:hypothetical protein